jgi:hypothetical protein
MFTRYKPLYPPWYTGTQVINLGTGGPRTNLENQAGLPRVWPTAYRVALRGIGAMPVFGLGFSLPVFNNQLAGGAVGYNVMMPGLGKPPFGG